MAKYKEEVIPQIIKDALYTDLHSEDGDRMFEYSATRLCKSPRQLQLEQRHAKEMDTPEIINIWYTFAGHAMHDFLENRLKNNPRYLVEKRIIRFDKPLNGTEQDYRRVGAKFDAYDKETKTLSDHKTTTTYIYGKEMKDEWIKQLMINAYFLEKEGYPVEKVAINAIYMDWRDSKLKYAKEGEYPPAPCTTFEMPCWSMEDREHLYRSLLTEHVEAESIPDDQLPYCSKEYCWESGGCFAVYRPGAAKAIRLCSTEEEAKSYIKYKNLTGDIRIEERPPTRRRCKDYCSAAPFCNQYKDWCKAHGLINESISSEPVSDSSDELSQSN